MIYYTNIQFARLSVSQRQIKKFNTEDVHFVLQVQKLIALALNDEVVEIPKQVRGINDLKQHCVQ